MLKWAVGIVIVLVLLAGAAGFVVTSTPLGMALLTGGAREPEATEVRVSEATRGPLIRTVNAPGVIEPRVQVEISAKVSARILELPFREGAVVQEGDVIARLDPEELSSRLDSARAQLRASEAGLQADLARLQGSRAALAQATSEYGRQRELADTGDIARSVLDQAEAAFLQAQSNVAGLEAGIESARAQIAISQAQIDEAQKNLNNAIVRAPMAGEITDLRVEVGEVVLGTRDNMGTVMMVIADRSRMLVKAQVDESNIAQIAAGQRVRVYINAYEDRQYEGVVERVDLTRQIAQGGTGFFETEIALAMGEGERLFSGLTANVDIEVQTFENALKVPSQCVLDRRVDELPSNITAGNAQIDPNKTFCRIVYRMVDGKAVATPVTVGASDLTDTAILGGLNEGDTIVSGPYRVLISLIHEDRIRIEGATPTNAPGTEPNAEAAESDAENAEADAGSEPAENTEPTQAANG
ncbi:MAG: HlyD family efflux transporter periplasmic adaptor subunit [Phycisphaeraceae bacterium]|nr:HlyD family efflux transporter periplasmic adaptor subunit [Phycisphaeraceae bacterium]